MWETWVRSLGWKDPLKKGTATHSSILVWRVLWTIYSMGSERVGHDRVTFTFFPFHLGWTSLYNIVQQLYFNEKKKVYMQKQKQNIGIKAHDGGCQGLWGGGSGEVLIKRYQLQLSGE